VAADARRPSLSTPNETGAKTTIGQWQPGRVNLERSLALGAELGAYVVTGHK
jgi:riboflavin synthase alpha subunit